jgi:hypothetical protein
MDRSVKMSVCVCVCVCLSCRWWCDSGLIAHLQRRLNEFVARLAALFGARIDQSNIAWVSSGRRL